MIILGNGMKQHGFLLLNMALIVIHNRMLNEFLIQYVKPWLQIFDPLEECIMVYQHWIWSCMSRIERNWHVKTKLLTIPYLLPKLHVTIITFFLGIKV